jgi:hypothetical protein
LYLLPSNRYVSPLEGAVSNVSMLLPRLIASKEGGFNGFGSGVCDLRNQVPHFWLRNKNYK